MLSLLSTSAVAGPASLPGSVTTPPKKWSQFDPLAKRCFAAAWEVFQSLPPDIAPDRSRCAVVLYGRDGSDTANAAYFRDYAENGRVMGSGLLFRYTLPSCPAAEAAIGLGLQGPLFYLRTESLRLDELDAVAQAETLDAILLLRHEGNRVEAALYAYRPRLAAVIPVYNHADTLPAVAGEATRHVPLVVVVDDGSTPPVALTGSAATAAAGEVRILRHPQNLGKGAALLTAFDALAAEGFEWAVTLDADGQHSPSELSRFVEAVRRQPDPALWIGVRSFGPGVPRSSRFGRVFSNFWVRLETGLNLRDTQSGFRAYPLCLLEALRACGCRRYDFEIESLVRLARGRVPIREREVSVRYLETRVSHFGRFRDNLRLSLLHARLTGRRLLPLRDKPLLPYTAGMGEKPLRARDWLFHPWRVLKRLATDRASPFELACSAFLGVFLGALPVPGVHIALVAYVTARFRLNQATALSVQNLCMPPAVPFLCVELGHLLCRGAWLRDMAWASRPAAYLARYGEWWLGACLAGPAFALLVAALVYAGARRFQSRRCRDGNAQRGNRAGMAVFRFLLAVAGVEGACLLLWPVSLWYALFDKNARRSAEPYLQRRFPRHGAWRRFCDVWRLFYRQGRVLILRAAVLAHPERYSVEVVRDDARLGVAGGSSGIIILSHAGCWQSVLPFLASMSGGQTFDLIMERERNAAVEAALGVDRSPEAGRIRILPPNEFVAHAAELVARVEQGGFVMTMGDRLYGAKAATATFFGEPARFPATPYRLAKLLRCPVYALFARETKRRRFAVSIERIDPSAQSYADALQSFLEQNPYEGFLFKDSWTSPAP